MDGKAAIGGLLAVGAVILIVAVGAVALVGCDGLSLGLGTDRQAQRDRAAADLARAEAEAYQARQAADTSAASERAAIREAARQAGHERTIELLPWAAMILGAVVILVLAILMAWDIRAASRAAAPASLLPYLIERDRLLERRLAELERRALPAAPGPVVIYDEGRR